MLISKRRNRGTFIAYNSLEPPEKVVLSVLFEYDVFKDTESFSSNQY